MVETKVNPDSEPAKASFSAEACLAKVTEVHKAALTIHLALLVATVTLTSYAIQQKKLEFFFVGSRGPYFRAYF